MTKNNHFNRQERAILSTLFKERRPMSLNELSEKASMSWITVKKYTERLQEQNVVVTKNETAQGNTKIVFNYGILEGRI